MSQDKQRLVGVIKVPLIGVAEDLGAESYAYVKPATYEDQLAVDELDTSNMSAREQVEWQLKVVREHFVSGKIKAFTGEEFELVDMTTDDAVATKHLADHLYFAIMGIDVDPKVIQRAATESAQPSSEESATETTSFEDSQAPSDTATSDK